MSRGVLGCRDAGVDGLRKARVEAKRLVHFLHQRHRNGNGLLQHNPLHVLRARGSGERAAVLPILGGVDSSQQRLPLELKVLIHSGDSGGDL